jgi:hypothetical protein
MLSVFDPFAVHEANRDLQPMTGLMDILHRD